MFQSIIYNNFFKYIITDSEFIDTINQTQIIEAVIDCYSIRNLDVAYNLFLFHKYILLPHGYDSIERDISYYKKYNESYVLYANDVMKYLERFKKIKSFW